MTTLVLLAHVAVVPHVHAEGVGATLTALAVLALGVAWRMAARDRPRPTTKGEAP